MLKEILAISGRPGLYRLVKYGKNIIIVENITDKKRSTAHSRDKVISLNDISMYTESGDKPLWEVLNSIKAKYDCKPLNAADYKEPELSSGEILKHMVNGIWYYACETTVSGYQPVGASGGTYNEQYYSNYIGHSSGAGGFYGFYPVEDSE